MSLLKYKQKRRFNETPEPKGKVHRRKEKDLTFMIHEHHASHLHFDLRLEMEGVLKSWAVPKGPSNKIGEKRLAVHVEDHPFSYGKFHGVIPKGNYGAGLVKIYDHGTYQSCSEVEGRKAHEKELLKGLKKGHIQFSAHGKKLKGEYDLVQMKGSKNWLLIKKKHHTKPKQQTGLRKFNLEKLKAPKKSHHSAPSTVATTFPRLPKSELAIQPMLATLAAKPVNRPGWIYEIKWDGYRAITQIDGKKIEMISRNGLSYNQMFEPIVESLRKIKKRVILDGEVVVVDEEGRADFQLLQNYRQSGEGNLIYYVFDILSYEGKNLTSIPLLERKKILHKVLPKVSNIKYSEHFEDGARLFKQASEMGIEGIMAKNGQSTYQAGDRSKDWLKIKHHQQQEAVICGFTAPRHGRQAFGALVLGVYQGGKLTYVGHTGTGFTDQSLREMKDLLLPLVIAKSPFSPAPKTNMPVKWVKPKLICEVRFANWTGDNLMRQPVYLGLRLDKKVSEVKAEKAPLTKPSATKTKSTPQLNFTNLDKVFWPKEKYTKGDLIKYYQKMAPVMLPYLKDRPQSMHRHPDGIDGESFFQKDQQHLPEGLPTAAMFSETENRYINYLLCQDQQTLMYMANLGCIEINPWNSRFQTPDHPDYLVLDLDPLEVSFEKVIETAQAAQRLLKAAKIPSFPKTSGATGLHIYIPLGGLYTTEQVVQFAKVLAYLIHQQIPSITSVERSPAKRRRKVYIDYLQNRQNQTVAAAFSVRPRPGATVSTPLKWSEVKHGLKPTNFTVKNIFSRLKKVGDLWKGVLGKGIDLTKALARLEKLSKSKLN